MLHGCGGVGCMGNGLWVWADMEKARCKRIRDRETGRQGDRATERQKRRNTEILTETLYPRHYTP
eukprot:1173986-Rhodomonas_salina.4